MHVDMTAFMRVCVRKTWAYFADEFAAAGPLTLTLSGDSGHRRKSRALSPRVLSLANFLLLSLRQFFSSLDVTRHPPPAHHKLTCCHAPFLSFTEAHGIHLVSLCDVLWCEVWCTTRQCARSALLWWSIGPLVNLRHKSHLVSFRIGQVMLGFPWEMNSGHQGKSCVCHHPPNTSTLSVCQQWNQLKSSDTDADDFTL